MSAELFLGMFVSAFVLFVGFMWKYEDKIKKDNSIRKEENDKLIEMFNKLNESIIRLTEQMKSMVLDGETRNHRITEHGKEIDKNKERITKIESKVQIMEKVVDTHNQFIGNLQNELIRNKEN